MVVKAITKGIEVCAESFYLEEHSEPENHQFVFTYRIRIKNYSLEPVQLLKRHWIITDGSGDERHVKGDGVIGEKPMIETGEEFEYTSGSQLSTPVGTMHGTYEMRGEKKLFTIAIPCFSLEVPHIIN